MGTAMARMKGRSAVAFALALVAVVPAAASAKWHSLYSGPGPRPGPAILYRRAAVAPQLTSRSPWKAKPILVSGTTLVTDVLGNYVGTDVAGTAKIANKLDGIRVAGGSGTTIGGLTTSVAT